MYFPYLRGKRFELLTLRECAGTIASAGKIVPIIEPVRENPSDLIRSVKAYNKTSMPFVLVVNPQVGQLKSDHLHLRDALVNEKLLDASRGIVGFLITAQTTIPDVEKMLSDFSTSPIAIIHAHSFAEPRDLFAAMGKSRNIVYQIFVDGKTSASYRDQFNRHPRILVRDAFERKTRNADYPADEFFTDLHQTYVKDGFNGFGDFNIVGHVHSDKGGPAHAVAIHLTYDKPNGEIWIRHFVSDRTKTRQDKAGKFKEALEKLISFLDKNPSLATCSACVEFRDLHARKHFPELGSVKRLSMKHHIDLMARFL